jgi:[ribosomal protein S18]-alanine N-acetyltransferase
VTIAIRRLTPDDLPGVIGVEREAFAGRDWYPEDFLKYDCMVAEIEGRVAGFLVSREVFPATEAELAEREILNLAVAPLYRKLGIASALLDSELRRPATHVLEVRCSNAAAQKLYRKFGFAEIGIRPNYYQSPPEDAIVMQMK